jgi:hypothetical protein
LEERVRVSTIATGVFVLVMVSALAAKQKLTPVEAATRLSGTWVLNRELSTGFKAPAAPGGPGRGGGALFAMAPGVAQGRSRGGGGAGAGGPADASDMSPAEIAAMTAMRQLQQLADMITITATADTVLFVDARGERRFAIDGKNARIEVAGAEVTTKSRWDKAVLKQEFSTAQSKLTQTWDVDTNGRLVLVAKVESLRLITPDQKAVFERKP